LYQNSKWYKTIKYLSLPELKEVMYKHYFNIRTLNNVRINFTSDNIIIYANDLDGMTIFDNCHITIREADVIFGKDTIYRKHSEFKYRIYFKYAEANTENNKNVLDFLTTYKNHVNPSLSLKKWARFKLIHSPAQSHFFFDVNDKKLTTIFSIMAPEIKTRVNRIISDKYS